VHDSRAHETRSSLELLRALDDGAGSDRDAFLDDLGAGAGGDTKVDDVAEATAKHRQPPPSHTSTVPTNEVYVKKLYSVRCTAVQLAPLLVLTSSLAIGRTELRTWRAKYHWLVPSLFLYWRLPETWHGTTWY
jgi:hypothetical protein